MPYEVSFKKPVPLLDREEYINECCVGGDAVVNRLLPSIQARHTDIQTNQEDWGWFIWFRMGNVRLAIDVFTDDSQEGQFRIHLTSETDVCSFLRGLRILTNSRICDHWLNLS